MNSICNWMEILFSVGVVYLADQLQLCEKVVHFLHLVIYGQWLLEIAWPDFN